MTTYISLLRGINVSGQKKILMDDLRKLYEQLGFMGVKTYIQSGNIIFDAKGKQLKEKIESGIKKKFGLQVSVLIKSIKEFAKILQDNPFSDEKVYFTFLFSKPEIIDFSVIDRFKKANEEIKIHDGVIYFHCLDGYGKTKLSNNFFENKLKVIATTRNLRTVKKLIEIAG